MQAPSVIGQNRFDLSSDALLISSGAYAAAASVVLPLWWAFTGRNVDPAEIGAGVVENSALAWVIVLGLSVIGFWIGPAIAWRLHGRRQRFRLVIAPIVSPVIVILLAALGPIFAGLYHLILDHFISWPYSGEAAAFGVLGAVHIALVFHAAVRIKPHAGDSVYLRGFRYFSIGALAVLTIIIAAALLNGFEGTVVQALLFFLLIGYAAGLTTHMAAAIDDMDAQGTA
jgi:hypothetical protein